MPENLLLLLPLIGGYIFSRNWHRTKLYCARWEKERLLINSASAGLLLTALAFLLIRAEDSLPCANDVMCFPRWPMNWLGVDYFGLIILATLLGALGWIPLNILGQWRNYEERFINNTGTLLDILVNDSMKRHKSVMITLLSGKVYTGIIASAASPGHSRPMIKVLPASSGYRDGATHEVVFTTNYSESLEEIARDCDLLAASFNQQSQEVIQIEEQLNKEPAKVELVETLSTAKARAEKFRSDLEDLVTKRGDLGILIPVDQIMTITLYHVDLHAKYLRVKQLRTPHR